jgi:hypothetical protein
MDTVNAAAAITSVTDFFIFDSLEYPDQVNTISTTFVDDRWH